MKSKRIEVTEKPRSGRPKVLTNNICKLIKNSNSENGPTKVVVSEVSIKKLAAKGENISCRSIQRFLKSQSWGIARKQPQTFLITERNIRDRLEFAKN